ncbi:hypothetical protein KKC83_02420 [Patescibacteria group bacterium]|nr:hypothetical protein [Candidatus Falkowbacteria bacterium]MBU3905995.1 hypothetical protein [Patescibacteria group bacterium]MCG2697552.1 hypothetical protein [Candidatus Parcubacteria bacterium]MBU4014782.1 hypothetical protein [Patescibacteria group bacterium]MBU4026371.1 hypothetical protein [Patescibacteria group bacterium]
MKKITTLIIFMFVMASALTIALPAVNAQADFGFNYAENLELGNADPRDAAVSLIKVIMTFLGLIAVVVILIGGFKWLTSGGSEDKIGEAKQMIIAGVIGLIIILAAWAITAFVVNQMATVVT